MTLWRVLKTGHLILFASVMVNGAARAADIEQLSVHYSGAINMSLRAVIDAPEARVAAILDNPADLARLLPGAASVKSLKGAPAGTRRLRIEMQGCLLFFCPSLTDVMDLHPVHDGGVGVTVPSLSDFSAGRMSWRYRAMKNGETLFGMQARLVPRMWVPPIIGPYLIEHKVERQMKATVKRLEHAAKTGHLVPHPAPFQVPGYVF